MKTKADKLNVDKLVPVLADLNEVSDEVKNDGVKRYKYNSKIKDIEDKIPVITN